MARPGHQDAAVAIKVTEREVTGRPAELSIFMLAATEAASTWMVMAAMGFSPISSQFGQCG
jgi:hypothetical protein